MVGGGASLDGLVESYKKKLRLPAAVVQSKNIFFVIDKVKNPEFLTALGLVIWGSHTEGEGGGGNKFSKSLGGIFEKTKGLFSKIRPK
ncbi:hypothetical protein HGA64_05690 [Candidatus Falkowbacteria bacterium]|nr:hypothetical protein [Candidatus Falkowbacteria bacterium]